METVAGIEESRGEIVNKVHADALLALIAELYIVISTPDPEPQPDPAWVGNGAGHVGETTEFEVAAKQ